MPSILAFFSQANMHRRRKQFHFGGAERNTHCDAAICAARININKVSRVKYCGGPAPPPPPGPPGSYAHDMAYSTSTRQLEAVIIEL